MHKQLGVMICFLLAAVLACGLTDDVQDVVDTVDEGVDLLQEIDDSGTWTYLTDGLDALADQAGYAAVVRLQAGPVDEAGGWAGARDDDVTVSFKVDSDRDVLVMVIKNDRLWEYFIDTSGDSTGETTRVYQIEDGRYACLDSGDDLRLLSLDSLFEDYAGQAVGAQLLSVAKEVEDEEAAVAGRTATHYTLESRVPEALEMIKKLDNQDLQARLDQAGLFEFSGNLYLDEDTGALLRFDSLYHDITGQRRVDFAFEVTQWGGVTDLPDPAPDAITSACEEG